MPNVPVVASRFGRQCLVLDRHPIVVREVVVDRDLIERPVDVRDVRIGEVVLPVADADVEEVGRWEQVHDGAAQGVDPIGGNDVPRKARRAARGRTARSAPQWVPDEEGRAVCLRRLREIAGAFRRGWHLLRVRAGRLLRVPHLSGVEEEGPFELAGARERDRSAERPDTGVEARNRFWQPETLVRESIGIERLVTDVGREAAGVALSTGFGDDVDLRPGVASELRGVAVHHHADFLDGVHAGDAVVVTRIAVGRTHAIDGDVAGEPRRTLHGWQVRADGATGDQAADVGIDPWQRIQEAHGIAAARDQAFNR